LKIGKVYLLRENWKGLVRIGHTTNLNRRIGIMKTSMPMEYEVIHTIEHHNYKLIEKELHNRFREKRVLREWYALDDLDIQRIKRGDF
jgi:hypothetical protein